MAKDKPEEIPEEETADLTGLITVEKDGEIIHVNPVALDQHKSLGWKEVA